MAYSDTDTEVVDYQVYCLDKKIIDPYTGKSLQLRGPKPQNLVKNRYFVCLGAAQTFGRYCAKPYPMLLEEKIGLPGLNLGQGGAGPSFFGQNKKLLDYINNARFVIVQVMSGRSQDNSLFADCRGAFVTRRSDGKKIKCDDAYSELLKTKNRGFIKKTVFETRNNWINSYRELMEKIKIPKILFWFSMRKPDYQEKYHKLHGLFGQFPQLIDAKSMEQIRLYSDKYVECVSDRGIPQRLISRFTGKPIVIEQKWSGRSVNENNYYPSPEMHVDAATALEKVCLEIVSERLTNY